MEENKDKKELKDKDVEKVEGGIKIIVNDDNKEELSLWGKIVKILFKN